MFEPLMNLHVTIKRYNSQCKQCNENKHTKDHQELPGGRGDVEACASILVTITAAIKPSIGSTKPLLIFLIFK